MTNNSETITESQVVTAILPDQLLMRMREIRRNRPKMNMTQARIARDLGVTQSAVSKAMLMPEVYPGLSKKIEKYFDRIEISQNKVTAPEEINHA